MIRAACASRESKLWRLEKIWQAVVANSSSDGNADIQPSVALLGLCSDLNSTYLQGPAQAPPALRAAIACDSANPYAELGDSFNGTNVATYFMSSEIRYQIAIFAMC